MLRFVWFSVMRTSRILMVMLVFFAVFIPFPYALTEPVFNGYDYMWFEPGHYLHYTEVYNDEVKDLEVVYQETILDGIFMTFNFLHDGYYDSSLLGGVHSGKIILNHGYPSSNEFNLWFLVSLPISFADGDMWKYNDVGCRVDHVGDYEVDGYSFDDVIKISINSLNYPSAYSRGEGEAYLAKGIGVIEWEFRKTNGDIFKIEVEEYGELPAREISGRLTLDGRYPAKGYFIGLSNNDENDGTGRITDELGRFSFTAYGHKLTLRYSSLLPDRVLDWDELTEYELENIDSDIEDLTLSLGYPPLPIEVDIDKVELSGERVDVGVTLEVDLHCSWAWDGTDALNIGVEINGTEYKTDENGWISIPLQKDTVGEVKYSVTGVSNCDDYNLKTELVSPIWDRVIIPHNQTFRIQQGSRLPSDIAYYEFDKSTFQGSFMLNDTVTDKSMGKYHFHITGIIDEKYGLTHYSTDKVAVIVDQLVFNVIINDQRIDVGSQPEIAVSGIYQYDNEAFTGAITLIKPQSIDEVGEHVYKVAEIHDNKYGVNAFESKEAVCIWDRVKIMSSGAIETTTKPGETVTVWFKAAYEYDDEIFDSSSGILMINYEEASWNENAERWEIQVLHDSESSETFKVIEIEDNLYQLTVINHEAAHVKVSWETPVLEDDITGGIPGFTLKSILIGIIVVIGIPWRKNLGIFDES